MSYFHSKKWQPIHLDLSNSHIQSPKKHELAFILQSYPRNMRINFLSSFLFPAIFKKICPALSITSKLQVRAISENDFATVLFPCKDSLLETSTRGEKGSLVSKPHVTLPAYQTSTHRCLATVTRKKIQN